MTPALLGRSMPCSPGRGKRRAVTRQSSPLQLALLPSVLDFSDCNRILDPWADNHAVEKGHGLPWNQLDPE